jgi:hypothetical protein
MTRLWSWVLLTLIGASTGCSPPTPRPAAAGTIRLTASMISPVDIALEWHDPATDVAGHILEYTNHPETQEYVPLGFFPPAQTTFTHPRLIPETTFYYRVRPYYGPASNPVEVSLPKELSAEAYAAAYALPEDYQWAPPATLPESSNVIKTSIRNTATSADAAPSNLQAELATHTVSGFKLTWTDRSTDEQGFLLETRRAGGSEFLVCALVEPDINSFGWAFEPPEKNGSFRIRAYYYGEPSNVVMLLTGKDPSMTVAPEKIPQPTQASPSRALTGPGWQQSLQQLRDAGVPNNVLAGLVVADFELRWQKQLREFEQRYQAGVADDDARARFEARRDDEQEKELRTALGDEGFEQWDKDNQLRDLDLHKLQLSSSQTDALYQLRKDRARKDHALTEALQNREIDEADYNKQQSAAQQEYDQQFKIVLGDERYEALQRSEEGPSNPS